MKKLFLDTNFVIDYFIREEPDGSSEKLLRIAKSKGYDFYISFLTVANFAYILRKMPKVELHLLIRRLCTSFHVVGNDMRQIKEALDIDGPDFEDSLQYAAAKEARCSCIISRNKKDFGFSEIPVMSASEFNSLNF